MTLNKASYQNQEMKHNNLLMFPMTLANTIVILDDQLIKLHGNHLS
jgi:hypothetical protein